MSTIPNLRGVATKGELAASRRLAASETLPEDEALLRILRLKAGQAGLAALVDTRQALAAAQAGRDQARALLRAESRARQAARHDGLPSAWRGWFDGSARPNPGRCGIGALLLGPGGVRVEISRPAGHGDSSAAEYQALIALLDAAIAHGAADLTIYGDSQVVVNDVGAPEPLAARALVAWRRGARERLARIAGVRLRWVPRHKNQPADALSQRALDSQSVIAADVPLAP